MMATSAIFGAPLHNDDIFIPIILHDDDIICVINPPLHNGDIIIPIILHDGDIRDFWGPVT